MTGDSGGQRSRFRRPPDHIIDLGIAIAIFLLIYVAVVAATGLLAPGGVVVSGSMEPNHPTGDVVLFLDDDRAFDEAGDATGEAIVFTAENDPAKRILHRAHFHVEAGENWYERADKEHVGDAHSCVELQYCPAPHDGYITKGDANADYDQAAGISPPVRSEWINAKVVGGIPAYEYATFTNTDNATKVEMNVPLFGSVPTEVAGTVLGVSGVLALAGVIRVVRVCASKLAQR